MPLLFRLLVLCAALSPTGAVMARDDPGFPGIEKLMTPGEYRAAGIDRLTPAQREALNQWLIRYTAGDSQVPLNTDGEIGEATGESREAAGDSQVPLNTDREIGEAAGDSRVPLNTDREIGEAAGEREIIARLSENFSGWTGETLFRLDNGQVWQQRRRGFYTYRGPANPAVRITKNFMGFYRMEMVESGKSVQVKRVK